MSDSGHGYSGVRDHEHDHETGAPRYSNRSFGRLQILHPISLLVLVASLALTTLVVQPHLDTVAKRHVTFFNPNNTWLAGYWALLLLLQVGTALSVALASGDHTKALLANGVSAYLPLANIAIAIWAPLFILDDRPTFIAGEVVIGIATVLLLLSTLITGSFQCYRPTWKRPVEWLLIHLPVRLFLAVMLQIDFWQQGIIAMGLANHPDDLKRTVWPTFIIVISTGVATALWSFATTDIALGGGSIFLQLSLLFNGKISERRPTEVFAAHILSIVLIGTALIASIAWGRLVAHGQGSIALGANPHEEAAIAQAEAEAEVAEQRARQRRLEAERLRGGDSPEPSARADVDATPSQLERGEGGRARKGQDGHNVAVTRTLGEH
ncbi:unnamed protein product [Parajaminaea phylloscopi]